jgi:dienelactone hydrolase
MKSEKRQFIKRFFGGLKVITRLFIPSGKLHYEPALYDPPSGTPIPTALDEPGGFSVKTYNSFLKNQEGRYSTTIYYPMDTGVHPAVVFSPGLGAYGQWYQWIGKHLASHGFIVLIFTVPIPIIADTIQQEAGFMSGFEFLMRENEASHSDLFGRVDTGKRALMGHSLGGASALAAASKMEVDAIVALAPAPLFDKSLLGAISAPTQIQIGSFDTIVGEKTAASYYDLLTVTPKQFLTLNGANHLDFHDVTSTAYSAGNRADHPATVDTNSTQRLSRRYFTAWLYRFLKDDPNVSHYLFGQDAQQDLSARQLAVLKFVQS